MSRRVLAIASFVLAIGIFIPAQIDHSTFAAYSDREFGAMRLQADVPIGTTCVFWANSTTDQHTFKITGSRHLFDGCVHSNMELEAEGSQNIFNRTVRYVETFKTNDNEHEFRGDVREVDPQPFPNPFNLSRYAPGGAAAIAAAAAGKYFVHTGNVVLDGPLLRGGLHYVQGSVTIGEQCTPSTNDDDDGHDDDDDDDDGEHGDSNGAGCTIGNITVVATGRITFTRSDRVLSSYVDGVLFFSNSNTNGNAITLGGSNNTLTGSVYAPRGLIHYSGQSSTYIGQIEGETIHVAGSRSKFIGRTPSTTQGSAPSSPAQTGSGMATQSSLALPHVGDAGIPGATPAFVSVGDFFEDGLSDIAFGFRLGDTSLLLVSNGTAPLLIAVPPDVEQVNAEEEDQPLLNPEFDLPWMTEETMEEPPEVGVAIELLFDSTGSLLPGLSEQEGDRPAAFWTYRAYSGDHHPHGFARGGAGRVAVVVDPRDGGPDKAILAQAVGQRPHVGRWQDPQSVVVNVEAVYNANVTVRVGYYSVEDPRRPIVTAPSTLLPYVGEQDLTFTFDPGARGTMTEFFVVLSVDGMSEGVIVIDSIKVHGAREELAFTTPDLPPE